MCSAIMSGKRCANSSANSPPIRIRFNFLPLTPCTAGTSGPPGRLLITAMLFLGVLMLMAGSLTAALMFGVVTWLIWWAWLPSTDDPQQRP